MCLMSAGHRQGCENYPKIPYSAICAKKLNSAALHTLMEESCTYTHFAQFCYKEGQEDTHGKKASFLAWKILPQPHF